jgi:hypothetical protein
MATESSPSTRERSIGELFGELATETSTLVRQEVKLATTEMSEKASFVAKKSAWVLVGALMGVVSLMTFAAAIVLLLGRVLPLWESAVIVAAAVAVLSYSVVRAGLTALRHMELRPTETIASMQENKRWVRKQLQ